MSRGRKKRSKRKKKREKTRGRAQYLPQEGEEEKCYPSARRARKIQWLEVPGSDPRTKGRKRDHRKKKEVEKKKRGEKKRIRLSEDLRT